jgi:hypothetical protein
MMDFKVEVVTLAVSDVGRAKAPGPRLPGR